MGPPAFMEDSRLSRWPAKIAQYLGYVAAAGIFALMALVFVSVFFRYLLDSPILATEDMMAVLLGITIFTAVPRVTLGRSHITVELFVAPFRKVPALDRVRKMLIDLGIVGMTFYMGYLVYLQAVRQFDRETESLVMEWPLWPATAAFAFLIAVGGLLFAMRAMRDRGQADAKAGLEL